MFYCAEWWHWTEEQTRRMPAMRRRRIITAKLELEEDKLAKQKQEEARARSQSRRKR